MFFPGGKFKQPVVLVVCVVFSLLYSFFSSLVYAEQISARNNFELAEKYLLRGNLARFNELYRQLHYYPLQPYLQQQKLSKNLSIKNIKEVDEFLKNYRSTPLDWPLRKQWLQYLAKNKRSSLYIKYYRPTSNADLACQYHLFQLKEGLSHTVVMPEVTKLWVVGKSQPKTCDPLFEQWQKKGYRSDEVIWQRIVKAADGGKSTLLPYLIRLLPKNMRKQGELWRQVRINPTYVAKLSRFPLKDKKTTEIITYALQRYIWRDLENAPKVFAQAKKLYPFTEQQINQITEKFAVALASKGHALAATWLAKLNEEQYSTSLIQWRITELVRSQDWPNIKAQLLTFPKGLQSKLQWRYWYGRSLFETGQAKEGESVLASAAKERHYYGFLAAGFLQKKVNLNDQPITITKEERYKVLSYASGKRAFEFFHLGRYLQARSEWNYWQKQLTERERLVASKLANEFGWYDRAIFTLSYVGYLNDVDLRFPLAFDKAIISSSNNHKINPAWAFAIARRESSFMPDANSPVGARGLMQIMPATAKLLTRKRTERNKLFDATNNINLGTKYLGQLSARYKGNQILATASYNAGPHRVKAWLKERPELPADIWIETIPYKETRDYVKSVMAYQQIYQLKIGQKSTLFTDISRMQISKLL